MLGRNRYPKSHEITSSQQKERMPCGNTHCLLLRRGRSWISLPFPIAIGCCLIKSVNFDASGLFFLELCLQWLVPAGDLPHPSHSFGFWAGNKGISRLFPHLRKSVSSTGGLPRVRFRAEPGDSCRCHHQHLLFLSSPLSGQVGIWLNTPQMPLEVFFFL